MWLVQNSELFPREPRRQLSLTGGKGTAHCGFGIPDSGKQELFSTWCMFPARLLACLGWAGVKLLPAPDPLLNMPPNPLSLPPPSLATCRTDHIYLSKVSTRTQGLPTCCPGQLVGHAKQRWRRRRGVHSVPYPPPAGVPWVPSEFGALALCLRCPHRDSCHQATYCASHLSGQVASGWAWLTSQVLQDKSWP